MSIVRRTIYPTCLALLLALVGTVSPLLTGVAYADAPPTGTVTGWDAGLTISGHICGESISGSAVRIWVSLDGKSAPTFCTNMVYHVYRGDQFVTSENPPDCRVVWLIAHYPPTDDDAENAARQAAIWHFSDGFDVTSPADVAQQASIYIAQAEAAIPEEDCTTSQPDIDLSPASALLTLPDYLYLDSDSRTR